MTKQEIKDNYAREQGYDNWSDLQFTIINRFYKKHACKQISVHEDRVMEIYAMECLKKASDRFEETTDKFYIHNENNLIK